MTTIAICCLLILSLFLVLGPSIALDSVYYVSVGCHKDKQENPRPLPELIHNYRLGKQIDWEDLHGSVIEQCAREARKRNYLYFGIQFYGECWSGPQAHETYSRDGVSSDCEHGVGKQNTNMVYRLTGEENECRNYHVFDTKERSVSYDIQGSHYACDGKYGGHFVPGWYRFEGKAGSLLNDKPLTHRCLTRIAVWYNGSYPEVTQGILDGQKACFPEPSEPCVSYRSMYIRIRNCGKFYVYDLEGIPGCPFRYCGNGIADELEEEEEEEQEEQEEDDQDLN